MIEFTLCISVARKLSLRCSDSATTRGQRWHSKWKRLVKSVGVRWQQQSRLIFAATNVHFAQAVLKRWRWCVRTVAVSWCGGLGVKKQQVLARRLCNFWGARAAGEYTAEQRRFWEGKVSPMSWDHAASPQLPTACRQHFATVMWKFAWFARSRQVAETNRLGRRGDCSPESRRDSVTILPIGHFTCRSAVSNPVSQKTFVTDDTHLSKGAMHAGRQKIFA